VVYYQEDLPSRSGRQLRAQTPKAIQRRPRLGAHEDVDRHLQALFRTLAAEGVTLSEGLFRSLLAVYKRTAEDHIERFHADSAINGLEFDRHGEETAVEAFTRALDLAGRQFVEDPLGAALIPNWNRVTSAIPGILDELYQAVEADNKQ
jgi:glucosyl-3-phosphoglycerate synthase